MAKMCIKVTNEYDQVGTKVWELDDDHQGWSFYDVMSNGFNMVFTKDPEVADYSADGFQNEPMMRVGGPLKANKMNVNNGARLQPADQTDYGL